MPMAINPHAGALSAPQGKNGAASRSLASTPRPASGLQGDDARGAGQGLTVAEGLHAKASSLSAALSQAHDAISVTQTADDALGKVGDALLRMRELAVQAGETTAASPQRESLNSAFGALARDIQDLIAGTRVKGQAILAADAGTQTFQVGAGPSAAEPISVTTPNLAHDPALKAVVGDGDKMPAGLVAAVSAHHLDRLVKNIDDAIKNISGERDALHAPQSRFASVITILRMGLESQSTPPGRIADADAASAAVQRSRTKILQMAGSAMAAQANLVSQTALQLLDPH